MWNVQGTTMQMAEEDYGVKLPITVDGTTMTEHDMLRFIFKKQKNGDVILTKEYTPVENTANLEFTAEESALFPPGTYAYSLDWYQSGNFMCNIISYGTFKVVDKA